MFKAYKEVGMEFGTDKWIGFVSDNGPDMANAQRLMREDLEIGGKVFTVPCMAHQTNLLVKKIINSSVFEPIIKMLLSVINHFRNSNLALAKLRELSQNPNLTPQYPCITRWATFSKAAETILSLKDNIRVMAITHSDLLTTNGRIDKRQVINAIENADFWEKLKAFYDLLRPYDHIIMILESEQATLGKLQHHGRG
ncbi:unnamed protein product [Rhizophagus irregularis]|nr:unnamed protein product [Rhizophagus irregularis]